MSGEITVGEVERENEKECRSDKHTSCCIVLSVLTPTPLILSFPFPLGPVLSKNAVRRLDDMPKELFDLKNTEAMDGNSYLNQKLHQAYHHYIKVNNLFFSTLNSSYSFF